MKVIGGVILNSGEMGSRCRLHVANRDGDGSFAADETILENDVTRPVAIQWRNALIQSALQPKLATIRELILTARLLRGQGRASSHGIWLIGRVDSIKFEFVRGASFAQPPPARQHFGFGAAVWAERSSAPDSCAESRVDCYGGFETAD
jgi:hypothetical protein